MRDSRGHGILLGVLQQSYMLDSSRLCGNTNIAAYVLGTRQH